LASSAASAWSNTYPASPTLSPARI
jgi:hypothetical protein